MAWSVRILGGAAPETWRVEHFPADADEQDRAVRERFPARSLHRCAAGPRSVTYAERVGSAPARGPELAVVTEHGPDAGRLVLPSMSTLTLTRRTPAPRTAVRVPRRLARACALPSLALGLLACAALYATLAVLLVLGVTSMITG